MLELWNETPFAAAIVPGLDKEGRDIVTIVVKGTFDIGHRGGLSISGEQVPLRHAEAFHGEPGASSVKYEADACPAKRGTDVVLVGHARSIRSVRSLDVSLSAGPLRKVVRVHGDRVWRRARRGVAISEATAFTRMPLVYERAFGGGDLAVEDERARPRDPRNPVGVGFTSAVDPARVDGVRLPNLEDPEAPITAPGDRPLPAGFGFIARDWLPRRSFAGTYDDAWQAERSPFLPADFDPRFFNAAHPALTSARPFKGGESVNFRTVVHATSDGVATAFPDVCKTPAPPAPPVPIPYPNVAMSSDTTQGSRDVKIDGNPIMLQGSSFATSTGDEAGSVGGVVSGQVKGKAEFVNFSFDVMIEGKPVPRLGDMMVQNKGGAPNTPPMPEVQPPAVAVVAADPG